MAKDKNASKTRGRRMIASLEDFADTLERGATVGEKFTVRTIKLDLAPEAYDAKAVKQVRETLNVSQAIFAEMLGVSVYTVQAWEQGKTDPPKMARRLLDQMTQNPQRWIDWLHDAQQAVEAS